jgi:hypothetical protein
MHDLGSIGCISWLAHRLARSRVTASPKSEMPFCLNSKPGLFMEEDKKGRPSDLKIRLDYLDHQQEPRAGTAGTGVI